MDHKDKIGIHRGETVEKGKYGSRGRKERRGQLPP